MNTIETVFDIHRVVRDPESIGKAFAYLLEFALHVHYDVKTNNDPEEREINFKNVSKSKYAAYTRTCELFGAEPLKPIGWEI